MQNPLLHTPLIHPRVWSKRIAAAPVPPAHAQALQDWAAVIRDRSIFTRKETELRGAFLDQIFIKVLGYAQFGSAAPCTLLTEQRAGTGSADAALGQFSEGQNHIIAPFELKGPDTRNLDAIMPGRQKSPVMQVWEYALDTPSSQLLVVSNMLEIRVYAMGRGRQAYERFDLLAVADSAREYWRMMAVLGAPAVLAGELQTLLKDSAATERDITQALYQEYKTLRLQTIIALLQANGGEAQPYIAHAQKILDRVLFIAFCEDRGLLPEKLLEQVIKSRNAFAPQPYWTNFKGLFQFIDTGHAGDPLISAYNGGLFALDPALDALHLPDDACKALAALGKYDFASDVPVTVLGHIFEQSIEDLEKLQTLASAGEFTLTALQTQLQTKAVGVSGLRKTQGIVYTPDFITQFMVQSTVGAVLARRKAAARAEFELTNPQGETRLRPATKQEAKDYKNLIKNPADVVEYLFWQAWYAQLKSIKICDPACGSGAFLIAAFEAIEPAYFEYNEAVQALTGSFSLFDSDRDILTGNLYGVDLNAESIEITQLSLWLKTAKRGKKLENLNGTLKVGNSIVGTVGGGAAYSDKAFDWQAAFPEVAAAGGFDVVIGNPPYVKQQTIAPIKPYLKTHYAGAYHGMADLYAYFFEQGLRLLKPKGLLGFISSSTFFKTSSGEPLRRYLTENTALRAVVDFGDLQVFEGVTTYPAIVVAEKLNPATAANDEAAAQEASANELRFLKLTTQLPKDLGAHFAEHAQTMPQHRLQASGWQFEGSAQAVLRQKLSAGKPTLKQTYGGPLRGLLTGLNEAFVLSQSQRDAIVNAQPSASAFLKPFLEGKDLKKWRSEPQGLCLLLFKRGQTRQLMQRTDAVSPSEAWAWLQSTHPAIAAWLARFEAAAKTRQDQGDYWWELRACTYYDAFEAPKILYPDLSQGCKFSLENVGAYFGNTAYFIPKNDNHLLALLNSKAVWFYLRGVCEAMRGGEWRLRLFTQNIEAIPIPTTTQAQSAELAILAQAAQSAAQQRAATLKTLGYQILRDLAPGGASAKLPPGWDAHLPDFADFSAQLKTRYKRELNLAERNDWDAALSAARQRIATLSHTITQSEQAIDRIVYQLFELNAAEIALIEAT